MKKSLWNAIAILFAVVATGAFYQQLSWADPANPLADEQFDAKESSDLELRAEAGVKKKQEGDFKRQEQSFKRQAEEFKNQAKEFTRVQEKSFQFVKGGIDGQIRAAAEALRDADGDEAKTQATAKLKGLIDKFFEEDMNRRKEAVADMEERLQKLRAQLDRRRAKKQEIVDLQLKIVVNEADGLGFSSQPGFEGFNFRVPAPNMMFEVPVTTTYSPQPTAGGQQPEARGDAWQPGPVPTPGAPPLAPLGAPVPVATPAPK